MKKNILFLMPTLFEGGAETQFRNILRNLNNDKYNITVISLDKFDPNNEFIVNNSHITFINLQCNFVNDRDKNFKNVRYIFKYIKAFYKISKILNKNKYDICISYSMFMAPFLSLIKLFKIPILYSFREASDKIRTRKYLIPFYRFADIITCNTPYTKEILRSINLNQEINVILNGVEFKDDEDIDIKNIKRVRNIYLIARIHPIKNQMIALKALNKMPDKKLYIVGKKSDDKYYNELNKFIEKNNLNDRVEYIEFTTNIKEIYRNADVVLLPSYEEGLANVILESFIYNRYCISSNIKQNEFLLKDSRGGLFSPDNENELINCINEYECMNDEIKNKILKSNHEFVKKEFSIQQLIEKYEFIIDVYAK